MSTAAAMSFGELASGAGEWLSCLGYWIGPCDVAALHDITALAVTNAMSYQYDIEDQADRIGRVMSEGMQWREHFCPVAPVQLARAWSPLPTAIDILGPPDWTSIEPDPSGLGTKSAGCAWASPHADMLAVAVRRDSPDEERFRRLLAVSLMRAGDRYRGVLVVARPGWSYEHTTAASEATRRLMDAVGFVVYDRHP